MEWQQRSQAPWENAGFVEFVARFRPVGFSLTEGSCTRITTCRWSWWIVELAETPSTRAALERSTAGVSPLRASLIGIAGNLTNRSHRYSAGIASADCERSQHLRRAFLAHPAHLPHQRVHHASSAPRNATPSVGGRVLQGACGGGAVPAGGSAACRRNAEQQRRQHASSPCEPGPPHAAGRSCGLGGSSCDASSLGRAGGRAVPASHGCLAGRAASMHPTRARCRHPPLSPGCRASSRGASRVSPAPTLTATTHTLGPRARAVRPRALPPLPLPLSAALRTSATHPTIGPPPAGGHGVGWSEIQRYQFKVGGLVSCQL